MPSSRATALLHFQSTVLWSFQAVAFPLHYLGLGRDFFTAEEHALQERPAASNWPASKVLTICLGCQQIELSGSTPAFSCVSLSYRKQISLQFPRSFLLCCFRTGFEVLFARSPFRCQHPPARSPCRAEPFALLQRHIGAVVFPFLAEKASSELMPRAQPLYCTTPGQRQLQPSGAAWWQRRQRRVCSWCLCGPRGLFILLEKLGSS